MIKLAGMILGYAVVVALVMTHFFGHDVNEAMPIVNNNSAREMATILCCMPGVWFVMDYFQNRDNSPE